MSHFIIVSRWKVKVGTLFGLLGEHWMGSTLDGVYLVYLVYLGIIGWVGKQEKISLIIIDAKFYMMNLNTGHDLNHSFLWLI